MEYIIRGAAHTNPFHGENMDGILCRKNYTPSVSDKRAKNKLSSAGLRGYNANISNENTHDYEIEGWDSAEIGDDDDDDTLNTPSESDTGSLEYSEGSDNEEESFRDLKDDAKEPLYETFNTQRYAFETTGRNLVDNDNPHKVLPHQLDGLTLRGKINKSKVNKIVSANKKLRIDTHIYRWNDDIENYRPISVHEQNYAERGGRTQEDEMEELYNCLQNIRKYFTWQNMRNLGRVPYNMLGRRIGRKGCASILFLLGVLFIIAAIVQYHQGIIGDYLKDQMGEEPDPQMFRFAIE